MGAQPRAERQTSRSVIPGRPKLGGRVDTNDSILSSPDNGSTRNMEDHHRKHSFHFLRPRRSEQSLDRRQGRDGPHTQLKLDIESPPLVFYGQPSTSSGALLSGQLKLMIVEDVYEIEALEMRFVLDYICKKPFHAHCPDCAKQTVTCTSWKLMQGPTSLRKGKFGLHTFRFYFAVWLTGWLNRRARLPLLVPPPRPPPSLHGRLHGNNRLQPPSDPNTETRLFDLHKTLASRPPRHPTLRRTTPKHPHLPTHQPHSPRLSTRYHPSYR